MSRINTNVSSLIAQRVLRKNNDQLNTSLERLSTGLKINSGKDDPAGLIASENLRAEKTGITTAIDNAQRASNIIGTAEGGLAEVSSLLNEVQGLVSQTANSGGLSTEEKQANQLQVDSILNTINRIAQSTSFEGAKLLNGSYGYTTSGADIGTKLDNVQVNAARMPDGQKVNVVVNVTTSAQTGTITHTGDITGGQVTLEIAGNTGTEQLTFASGTTIDSVATAINGVSTATGVSATVSGGTLYIESQQYGADQFVSVKTVAATGTASFTTSTDKDFGRDADITVNGAKAQANGLHITARTSALDVEFDIDKTANLSGTYALGITGGGATFALGSKVSEADKAAIGIGSVSTGSLGDSTGYLSSLASDGANRLTGDNLVMAQKIVDKAIKQVSQLRGRLGAFQKYTIGSTINSLGVAYENASAAQSAIQDTDFAQETANLTRSQILSQAASTVLAQANASPQAALSLLRG